MQKISFLSLGDYCFHSLSPDNNDRVFHIRTVGVAVLLILCDMQLSIKNILNLERKNIFYHRSVTEGIAAMFPFHGISNAFHGIPKDIYRVLFTSGK